MTSMEPFRRWNIKVHLWFVCILCNLSDPCAVVFCCTEIKSATLWRRYLTFHPPSSFPIPSKPMYDYYIPRLLPSPHSLISHSAEPVQPLLSANLRRLFMIRPRWLPSSISSNQGISPRAPYRWLLTLDCSAEAWTDVSEGKGIILDTGVGGDGLRGEGTSLVAVLDAGCDSTGTCAASSAVSGGRSSKSSRSPRSSLKRLPTVTDIKSASSRGSSVQKVRWVPQNPQKFLCECGAWCGVNVRRMIACVSSG